MVKFFTIRSKIFISFTWLVLFALFIDAVNLDDYLPNSFSIHLDDIDLFNSNIVDDILLPFTGNSINTPSQEAKNIQKQSRSNSKDLVILYDLDSLCLAAKSSFEKETVFNKYSNCSEEITCYASAKKVTPQNLFLLYQSLVI